MPTALRRILLCVLVITYTAPCLAETGDYLEEDPYADNNPGNNTGNRGSGVKASAPAEPASTSSRTKQQPRKYFNDDSKRVDAGVFHVGFALGGNFYIEPRVDNNQTPTGDFYKDFGFQAGAYFDHDYSELDENIPLMLRGMIGYKYMLSSVHAFSFDGMVRRMFRFSEHASFGIGMGASAAVWFRVQTATSPTEEIILLPSLLLGAGFEFNPFMVDFKWAINRVGADNVIMGFELYFGFRL
ncbi:hypothetical protein K2X33_12790 [bacterium]|nr:hypothetical protein [bacterium]